jgi:transketolase
MHIKDRPMHPERSGAHRPPIRLRDLQAVFEAGAGHIGGEMSVIDLLTALYFHVLSVWPESPDDPDRDRFVLSKGHSALALYVVLAERASSPRTRSRPSCKPHSRLNGHPNRLKVPGVETNTGPLGHGLPVAVGMAKAAQLTGRRGAPSSSPATARCRRARTGKPSWRPRSSGSTTSR